MWLELRPNSRNSYPHDMPAIRLKVPGIITNGEEIAEVVTETGPVLAGFLQKVSSLTYGGAAVNFAFSPDPAVVDITADERNA